MQTTYPKQFGAAVGAGDLAADSVVSGPAVPHLVQIRSEHTDPDVVLSAELHFTKLLPLIGLSGNCSRPTSSSS